MKKLLWVLPLVALFSLSPVCGLFAESYQHPETGLVFPDRLAGMTRVSVDNYGPAEGISIGYNAPNIAMTISLYSGMTTVPRDMRSPVFKKQLAEIMEDVKKAEEAGIINDLKKMSEEKVFLTADRKGPQALCVSFTFTLKQTELLSKIYLMGYKNRFLSLRYSYNKDVSAQGEETLKQFLKEFSAMLEARNRR